jgi:hypothetical protein
VPCRATGLSRILTSVTSRGRPHAAAVTMRRMTMVVSTRSGVSWPGSRLWKVRHRGALFLTRRCLTPLWRFTVLKLRDVEIYDEFVVRLIAKLEAGKLRRLHHLDIASWGGGAYPYESGFMLLLVAWLKRQYEKGNRRIQISETMFSEADGSLGDVLRAVAKHWGMTEPPL